MYHGRQDVLKIWNEKQPMKNWKDFGVTLCNCKVLTSKVLSSACIEKTDFLHVDIVISVRRRKCLTFVYHVGNFLSLSFL